MQVKYAFVCDAANISKTGNLNVLGIFTNINAEVFPYSHPRFAFVIGVENRATEAGVHNLRVNFINEDGKDIIPPMTGSIEITSETHITNLMFDLVGVTFGDPGEYSIDVVMDNQLIRTESINVLQVPS